MTRTIPQPDKCDAIMMKEYPHVLKLDELWQHFEGYPLAHLATLEGDQPRVRMMALIAHKRRLWMATKTHWEKVAQIGKNPKSEISLPARDNSGVGCIRITARAVLVQDSETRKDLASSIPWFSDYWKSPEDPNFTLLAFEPERILYDHPSDGRKYTVELQ